MSNTFAIIPIIWLFVAIGIISKIMSVTGGSNHTGSNVPPPNYTGRSSSSQNRGIKDIVDDIEKKSAEHSERVTSHPSTRPKKSIRDKLNGEDQPKRGKLSRESREDEKDWF